VAGRRCPMHDGESADDKGNLILAEHKTASISPPLAAALFLAAAKGRFHIQRLVIQDNLLSCIYYPALGLIGNGHLAISRTAELHILDAYLSNGRYDH
jgi:hypothetical protein